jgi:hypothetical protein
MAIRGPKWFIIAALVSTAPETAGMFELWQDNELVFVGATGNSMLRSAIARDLLERDGEAAHSSWKIIYRQ